MFLGVRQFFNPLWLALHNVSQWIQLFRLHFMISFDEISSLRAKFQQLESEAEENKISLKEAATLAKDLKQEVKVMVKLRGKLSIMDKDLEEAKIK
ncbi:hypothetical protein QL285_027881 [Trifolium repens]|nr:hypothetical protein QL285_027881 [Trifolium repens]